MWWRNTAPIKFFSLNDEEIERLHMFGCHTPAVLHHNDQNGFAPLPDSIRKHGVSPVELLSMAVAVWNLPTQACEAYSPRGENVLRATSD